MYLSPTRSNAPAISSFLAFLITACRSKSLLCITGVLIIKSSCPFTHFAKQFSYSYRQRLNKAHSDQSFFDATDWLYLTYRPDEHWGLSVGKQVVGIGGYEYDRAPIDLYFCSEYWNNIPCYQMGISADYTFNRKKDKVMFQLCQSPFRAKADDMYSYNLMWYGSHGWFNTIYSVNMIEYQPDKYINYIALGHHLDFGKTALELDFMNRAADHQTYFFKNCSVMGELSYRPSESFNLFGKVTYDVNRTQVKADYCVHPGTELTHVGGGVHRGRDDDRDDRARHRQRDHAQTL